MIFKFKFSSIKILLLLNSFFTPIFANQCEFLDPDESFSRENELDKTQMILWMHKNGILNQFSPSHKNPSSISWNDGEPMPCKTNVKNIFDAEEVCKDNQNPDSPKYISFPNIHATNDMENIDRFYLVGRYKPKTDDSKGQYVYINQKTNYNCLFYDQLNNTVLLEKNDLKFFKIVDQKLERYTGDTITFIKSKYVAVKKISKNEF